MCFGAYESVTNWCTNWCDNDSWRGFQDAANSLVWSIDSAIRSYDPYIDPNTSMMIATTMVAVVIGVATVTPLVPPPP
jgi:hypothetical protein